LTCGFAVRAGTFRNRRPQPAVPSASLNVVVCNSGVDSGRSPFRRRRSRCAVPAARATCPSRSWSLLLRALRRRRTQGIEDLRLSGRPAREWCGDSPLSQPGADGLGAVALVADGMCGPGPGPAGVDPGYGHGLHTGGELGAVAGVAAGDGEAVRAAQSVAREVGFAGQTPRAVRAPGCKAPFRAPAACWWTRTLVESAGTVQSTAPATSAADWAARSIRRRCRGPPTGGTRCTWWPSTCSARAHPTQAEPVRNFHANPFRTIRSSSRFRPRKGTCSSARSNSHSESDSSWRRITGP
jgi:hypothetical protein